MIFIDTNIFIYAHDRTDLRKSEIARSLLTELSVRQEGRISTQVVQEFCNVVLKKSAIPLKSSDVRMIIREMMMPLLEHQPDGNFYLRACFKSYV